MKSLFVLFALACLVSTAQAQLTAENIQYSQWDTSYESLGGGKVRATLTFNGDGGSYRAGGSQGTLSNVNYDVRLGGGATITGNWSLGGTDGKFTFFVAGNSNPKVFSGAWQANGRSGGWSGTFVQIAQAGGGGGGVVYDKTWSYNDAKDYYYKKCSFPAGGYQYIIWYKSKPEWIYWYNPVKEVCWCACPTVKHPKFGDDIANGKDLFLMASDKAKDPRDTSFPSDTGANFKTGATAQDKDGSNVSLGCPPADLP